MNLNFVRVWLDVLIKPKETFQKEKKNVSVAKGLLYYFLAFLIALALLLISYYLRYELYSLGNNEFFLVSLAIPSILLLSIVLTVSVSFFHGLIGLAAKLFGGKGNIEEQYYLSSLFLFPLILIYAIINSIFSLELSYIALLLSALVALYALYLLTLTLSETYKYGKIRAFVTWLSSFLASILPMYFLMSYLNIMMC